MLPLPEQLVDQMAGLHLPHGPPQDGGDWDRDGDMFSHLHQALPGVEIKVPDEDDQDTWPIACVQQAVVVVYPTTTSEVSTAVGIATLYYDLRVTAFSEGYPVSVESSHNGVMVIDLRHMCATTVDPQAMTITFGGGCTWEAVNRALWEPHRLATVSATDVCKSAAALILGGGHGNLSGEYGLACDCLLSCEVVLSNGTVVTASEQENPDLFWAIRGAGMHMGIVTSFTSQAFPQTEDIWAVQLLLPIRDLENCIAFGNHLMQTTDGRQSFTITMGLLDRSRFTSSGPGLECTFTHHGSEAETIERITPLRNRVHAVGHPCHSYPCMYPVLDVKFPWHPDYNGLMRVDDNEDASFLKGFVPIGPGPSGSRLLGACEGDKTVYNSRSRRFAAPLDPKAARLTTSLFQGVVSFYERLYIEEARMKERMHLIETNARLFKYSTISWEFRKIRTKSPESTAGGYRGEVLTFDINMRCQGCRPAHAAILAGQELSREVSHFMGYHGASETAAHGASNHSPVKSPIEEVYGGNAPRLREVKARYDLHNMIEKSFGEV